VPVLRADHVVQLRVVERGGGLAGVRWPDLVPMPGADVAVLLQQSLYRAAVVAGVAARAAWLRLMPPCGPVHWDVFRW
jgi:hypothetical protein